MDLSPKPYLLRAIYEWCTDSGLTPHILVKTDRHTKVPFDYVKDGEIVLNISAVATDALHLGNEVIEFEARFNGVVQVLWIPVRNIAAIFPREQPEFAWSFPVELLDDVLIAPESAGLAAVSTPDVTRSESGNKTTEVKKDAEKRAKFTVVK